MLTALALSGCGGEPARQDEDAGSSIPPGGSLSHPLVVIGGREQDDSHLLQRVFGAVLLPSGIAVGNSGTGEIRFFTEEGRHAFSMGRIGSGPGEFRSINWMARAPGDSVLVWDMRGGRFTMVDPHGRYAREFQIQRPGRSLHPAGILPDSRIVLVAEGGYDPRSGAGKVRDVLLLFTATHTGASTDSITELPGAEWLLYDHAESFRAMRLPMGRATHVAVAGEHIVYASSNVPQVHFLDRSGRRMSVAELPLVTQPLSARDVEAVVDMEIKDAGERKVVKRHLARSGRSAAPVITGLHADSRGNVWVRTYAAPTADSVSWLILREGAEVRRVRLPARAAPLDLRGDKVLLRETDADGVESVSVREILR